MDDIFVTQPCTARHVRFTKILGFGSLGNAFAWDTLLTRNIEILAFYMLNVAHVKHDIK